MKNDPIIYAKASKIVEAIMKRIQADIKNYNIDAFGSPLLTPYDIQIVVTSALASLESSEREVLIAYEDYCGNGKASEANIQFIDRYLTEKGGEG